MARLLAMASAGRSRSGDDPAPGDRRLWVSWLVVVSVIAPLTGCTFPNQPTPADAEGAEPGRQSPAASATTVLGDIEAARAEYAVAIEELAATLPDAATFPENMPGGWDSDGQFESGVGDVAAAMYWRCAWLETYVTATGAADVDAAGTALERLAQWTSLSQVAANSDSELSTKWEERVIQPARAGDDTLLREIANQCDPR